MSFPKYQHSALKCSTWYGCAHEGRLLYLCQLSSPKTDVKHNSTLTTPMSGGWIGASFCILVDFEISYGRYARFSWPVNMHTTNSFENRRPVLYGSSLLYIHESWQLVHVADESKLFETINARSVGPRPKLLLHFVVVNGHCPAHCSTAA